MKPARVWQGAKIYERPLLSVHEIAKSDCPLQSFSAFHSADTTCWPHRAQRSVPANLSSQVPTTRPISKTSYIHASGRADSQPARQGARAQASRALPRSGREPRTHPVVLAEEGRTVQGAPQHGVAAPPRSPAAGSRLRGEGGLEAGGRLGVVRAADRQVALGQGPELIGIEFFRAEHDVARSVADQGAVGGGRGRCRHQLTACRCGWW